MATNIKLNKDQSKKADLLLKSLCASDASFDREEADRIFISESESDFVCRILEEKGLIDIIAQTENNFLYRFTKTDITCGFLKNGGLTREYRKSKKLDWYKVIPIILSLLFGFSTLFFANRSYNLEFEQNKVDTRVNGLENENAYLKSKVDSLNIQLNNSKNINSESLSEQKATQ